MQQQQMNVASKRSRPEQSVPSEELKQPEPETPKAARRKAARREIYSPEPFVESRLRTLRRCSP